MTVFSMRGSKILTDLEGQITDVQDTTLEAVTRIGSNTLDVAYLGDPQSPFAISLSDYNLLFDKVHINDSDLPTQVEFYDLASDDGYSARVLNFVFDTPDGTSELMFSVGSNALPHFRSPSEASLFFAQHEPTKVTAYEDWTLHLDQIQGVKTSGVFIDADLLDTHFEFKNDGFEFTENKAATNPEIWDGEFADASDLEDALSRALGPPPIDPDAAAVEADLVDSEAAETAPTDHNDT